MKKFAIVAGLLVLSNILFAQIDFDKHTCCKISHQEALAIRKKFDQPKEYLNYGFDIFYHRMNWEINPDVYYIKGAITTHFEASSNIDTLIFDMDELLSVDSIQYHSALVSHTHIGDVLRIPLDLTIMTGATDSVTVFYQGQPDQGNGFGSFVQGFHNSPPAPIISTLSEPFGAKDWWPCKESLDDKIDSIDIIVSCPEQFRTASNGMLQSDLVNGNIRTMHWKHSYPIATYLIAIAVSDYVVYSDYMPLPNNDSLEILNYVFPEFLGYAQERTPRTGTMIQLFTDLFAPYPFIEERYGHAMFVGGGGMEHQTMSFMVDFGFELTAHELAHQWFGNYITCENWHDIWLNEGFATYLAALCYQYIGTDWWEGWKTMTIEDVTSQAGGAVYCEDTTSVARIFDSRLSYRKGAMVLHMLRWELGDSAFFQGIQDYLARPDLAFGYAKSTDFIETMETSADTSLQGFFDDWLYGEGFPYFELAFNQDSLFNLSIELDQHSSHSSVSFFELHVPVLAVGATEDSLLVMHHTQNNQQFNLELDFKVEDLIFDPEYWIVTKDPLIIGIEEEIVAKDIRLFPNPTQGIINIEMKSGVTLSEVKIYNMEGRLVGEKIMDSQLTIDKIDLSEYPTGTYLLSMQTNKGKVSRKVMKE